MQKVNRIIFYLIAMIKQTETSSAACTRWTLMRNKRLMLRDVHAILSQLSDRYVYINREGLKVMFVIEGLQFYSQFYASR